jgi:hypothetical protein
MDGALLSQWSIAGCFLAAGFIFVTTADDTVWLIPVITSERYSVPTRALHGCIFVLGLQLACLFSWLLCLLFGKILTTVHIQSVFGEISLSLLVQIIGASVCWIIAIFLGYKKIMKWYSKSPSEQDSPNRSRKVGGNGEKAARKNTDVEAHTAYPELAALLPPARTVKPIASYTISSSQGDSSGEPSPFSVTTAVADESAGNKMWFVLTMTLAGAADEIMCFPALMLGGSFSYADLAVGCQLASLALLLILLTLYSYFKPIFDALDRIPLFVVVALFAVFQTVNIICGE